MISKLCFATWMTSFFLEAQKEKDASSVWELHYRIHLNKGFHSDLECFLSEWKGIRMISGVISTGGTGTITVDASGS